MTSRSLFLTAVALALPAVLSAQQPVLPSVPQSLTLEDALDLATRYNPGYRQVRNDRGPAAWGVRNAWASLFTPSFSARGTISYQGEGSQTFLSTQFVQPSSTIGSSYGLNLSWQLSGQTLTRPGLAKAQLNAAEANIEGAANTLRAVVEQQYLTVLQAEAQVDLAEVQLERNEEFLRLAQARFDVGQATQLDVRQAQVARGRSQVALLQARQNVVVEKLRLFQQLGIPAPDDPAVVTLTDTFPVVEPTWELHTLLGTAERENPGLNALQAQASAARWSEKAAKSEWLPSLSFNAGWSGFTQEFTDASPLVSSQVAQARAQAQANVAECEFTNQAWLNPGETPLDCSQLAFTDAQADQLRTQILQRNDVFPFDFTTQPFSASLTVSLPIFTQFGRPQRAAQAAAQADDAREAAEERRLLVRTEVSQAYYTLTAAYESIAIQEQNVAAAAEQLRLATERYRVGSGTFFELLDAQLAAQQAEADHINAIYAYHRAVASLESAVGRRLRQ